jgi:multiple sugar transport system permease protein
MKRKKKSKIVVYIVCIILAILSILPFWIMIVNATRSTPEIQSHAISLIPSTHIQNNIDVLNGKTFNPFTGFINSLIISTGATLLAIYFSTLTAYGLFAYRWKMRQPFFTLVMAVMMIPTQVISIGFFGAYRRCRRVSNFQ